MAVLMSTNAMFASANAIFAGTSAMTSLEYIMILYLDLA